MSERRVIDPVTQVEVVVREEEIDASACRPVPAPTSATASTSAPRPLTGKQMAGRLGTWSIVGVASGLLLALVGSRLDHVAWLGLIALVLLGASVLVGAIAITLRVIMGDSVARYSEIGMEARMKGRPWRAPRF